MTNRSHNRISEKAQKLEASGTNGERGVGGGKMGEVTESLYNRSLLSPPQAEKQKVGEVEPEGL